MKDSVSKETQKKIRGFFKELINIYRKRKYIDEIIKTNSKENKADPTFQLKFIKKERKVFIIEFS
jgi:hypothetical protein